MAGTPTDPPGPLEPREVVTAYIAALNAHDPDAVAALVSEEFFNEHTAVHGESLRGREQYRARLEGFLATMEDLHYEIEDVVAEGDRVVVAYAMSADYLDDGTRHPFTIRGVFRFVVHEHQIAHRIDYRDGLDFERQVRRR